MLAILESYEYDGTFLSYRHAFVRGFVVFCSIRTATCSFVKKYSGLESPLHFSGKDALFFFPKSAKDILFLEFQRTVCARGKPFGKIRV